jgi:hypothetical protein
MHFEKFCNAPAAAASLPTFGDLAAEGAKSDSARLDENRLCI